MLIGDRSMNMETYLRRTYVQRSRSDKDQFPFWDYRSRRNAFSGSNSSFNSSGSSCDGSSISSGSSPSDPGSESVSISDQSDTDSLMPCDQIKMSLQFLADAYEISSMEELYQPLLNCIDPDLHVVKVADKSECMNTSMTSLPDLSAVLPSMAVMLFLQEEGALGFKRTQTVQRCFEKSPWKFHHSEHVTRGAINPYPYNSRDFYYTSEDLPLWAVRQVHAGKEFFRTMLFIGEGNWNRMLQFYKLVLGREPDMKRDDFCLFTVNAFQNYDIQLALKKLKGDTKPRVLEGVKLQFKVSDLSNIVALLPNLCTPLSDTRWETTDVDGNSVVLETPPIAGSQISNSSFSERSSLSDRSSLSERSSLTGRVALERKRGRRDSNHSREFRASAKNRHSFNQRNDNASSKTQRTRSFVDDDAFERMKSNSPKLRKSLSRDINENQVALERSQSDYSNKIVSDSSKCNDINSQSGLRSFYV